MSESNKGSWSSFAKSAFNASKEQLSKVQTTIQDTSSSKDLFGNILKMNSASKVPVATNPSIPNEDEDGFQEEPLIPVQQTPQPRRTASSGSSTSVDGLSNAEILEKMNKLKVYEVRFPGTNK